MVNRKRPMESHDLETEGNRGLSWAEAHTDPGVVPPSTHVSWAEMGHSPRARDGSSTDSARTG